jgi:hypothetical protein
MGKVGPVLSPGVSAILVEGMGCSQVDGGFILGTIIWLS